MARKPRLHIPGAVYHVIQRGNARQPIFLDAYDRHHFYSLIAEGVERFEARIHSFCLMTNHFHLALQVGDFALARIMQNLEFRYVQRFNKRHKRVGYLFQDRYRAILIDEDSYLLDLVRYVHLNPVRARVVEDPKEYQWSSHRAYLGDEFLPWLTTERVLGVFDREITRARELYRNFIDEGKNTHGDLMIQFKEGSEKDGRILGKDTFIEGLLRRVGQGPTKQVLLDEILRVVCHIYEVNEAELAASVSRRATEARALSAVLVGEQSKLSLTELSRRLAQNVSTISMAAKRLLNRSKSDADLSARIVKARRLLGSGFTISH